MEEEEGGDGEREAGEEVGVGERMRGGGEGEWQGVEEGGWEDDRACFFLGRGCALRAARTRAVRRVWLSCHTAVSIVVCVCECTVSVLRLLLFQWSFDH